MDTGEFHNLGKRLFEFLIEASSNKNLTQRVCRLPGDSMFALFSVGSSVGAEADLECSKINQISDYETI